MAKIGWNTKSILRGFLLILGISSYYKIISLECAVDSEWNGVNNKSVVSCSVLKLFIRRNQLSTASHDTPQNSPVTTLIRQTCLCCGAWSVFAMLDFMFKQNFLMVKSAKCIQPRPVHIITVGVMHTSLSVCVFSDYTNGSTGIYNLLLLPCNHFLV